MDHSGELSNTLEPLAFIRDLGAPTVVFVSGDIDALTAPDLRNAVLSAMQRAPRALVVDLTEVQFLAAVGLEVFPAARDAVPGTPVAVVADNTGTRRPIELTDVIAFVSVFSTLFGGLEEIGSKRG